MSIKNVFILILLSTLLSPVFTQQTGVVPQGQTGTGNQPEEHLQLAISSRDYPVTLGDFYRLTYRQAAGTMISMDVQIDGTGFVSLGAFGKIDASRLTFVQLKQKIEDLISKNYSHSLPELSIVSPGVFRVTVRDGSSRIQYSSAWGLSRLSEIVAQFYSSATSLRNVELISLDGVKTRYDLQLAALSNESGLDPLVKPGDTIILQIPGRVITLQGEVRRPGRYELITQEGLKDLIETFGGGLSNQADPTRVRLDRTTETSERTDYISLPAAYTAGIVMNDGDSVLIRARAEQLPIIWFEGAVIAPPSAGTGSAELPAAATLLPGGSVGIAAATAAGTGQIDNGTNGRFAYPIRDGQMLSDILQDIRNSFHPLADLRSAILYTSISAETGLTIDIQSLLSGTNMATDLPVLAGYRIVIPVIRNTIMVSGAVYAPGAVPYKPNAPVDYYIILAGGADPWRNSFRSCDVYDQNGNRKKASQKIQPGDQIHVRENNVGYLLERRVPLLASIVGLLLSVITLSLVVQ